MANDLTTTARREITTLSGASALRRIERLASIAEDVAEQARSLLPSNAAELVAAAREEARMWLTPATKRDAKGHLSPTLALVAPVGMSENDVTAWLGTAMHTLSGIPADLLARGCKEARLKVDHPSKIVMTINAEVGDEWRRRRERLAAVGAVEALLAAPLKPPPVYATPEEIAAIKAEYGIADTEPARRGPPATAADYMAMGLSEHEAHKAVADHARMMGRTAKPIGACEPARAAARQRPPPPEIGHGLIATTLARRFAARRAGDRFRAAGNTQTLAGFIATYGQPSFRTLLPLTRAKLRDMRADLAA